MPNTTKLVYFLRDRFWPGPILACAAFGLRADFDLCRLCCADYVVPKCPNPFVNEHIIQMVLDPHPACQK